MTCTDFASDRWNPKKICEICLCL